MMPYHTVGYAATAHHTTHTHTHPLTHALKKMKVTRHKKDLRLSEAEIEENRTTGFRRRTVTGGNLGPPTNQWFTAYPPPSPPAEPHPC